MAEKQVNNGEGGGASLPPKPSAKSNSNPGIIKDRKSPEETIFSLRCELRTLYDSLSDKNEQLLLAERDIRDRDISIRFMKSEFKKLLEQNKKDAALLKVLKQKLTPSPVTNNNNGSSLPIPASSSSSGNVKRSSHEVVEEHLRGQDATDKLQLEIKERDSVIVELNQKVIRLSEDMSNLQEELNMKSDRVVNLQNEIDKFQQVVRPLTRHMIETKRQAGIDFEMHSAGVESSRLLPVFSSTTEPRMKRTAISAEPLSMRAGMEDDLVKIPKSVL